MNKSIPTHTHILVSEFLDIFAKIYRKKMFSGNFEKNSGNFGPLMHVTEFCHDNFFQKLLAFFACILFEVLKKYFRLASLDMHSYHACFKMFRNFYDMLCVLLSTLAAS